MEKVIRKVEVTPIEAQTIVDALHEWQGYLESVDLKRNDIDPEQIKENIRFAKELSNKWWSIKCELDDAEIISIGKNKVDHPHKSSYTVN